MLLKESSLEFISRHALPERGPGRYRYSLTVSEPTLYSSCYAVLTRDLYGDLATLTETERQEWLAYLNTHQDPDGLYRDPVIFDQGWYAGDPFHCGRPHLTCHVIQALTCLGGVAPRPFALAEEYASLATLAHWLQARDWGARVAWTGNEIMNLGNLLQYSRDYHHDDRAGRAVSFLLDWLEANHLDPATGVWGSLDLSDPLQRSHAVQAAYHWWPLFAYDRRPFPCAERALDTVLATQNPRGGFGWGVHNPEEPFNSSACEDIDSLDPLARLSLQTQYRREEIYGALRRAREWVLENRMPDGGFVFMRGKPFEYGHPALRSEAGQGAMFPTWFRTLSLAILETALGQEGWRFCPAPGNQLRPTAPV